MYESVTHSRDALLDALGLRVRQPAHMTVSTMGLFCVGMLVGTGVAILLAPESGVDLRHRIGEKADGALAAVRQAAQA